MSTASSIYNQNAQVVVLTDENFEADVFTAKVIATAASITVTLPLNPTNGTPVEVVCSIPSEVGYATVHANSGQTGGPWRIFSGNRATFTFAEGVWTAAESTGTSSVLEANWYIDAVNGDDSNTGTTSDAPLKTFAQLAKRWGVYSIISPGQGTSTIVHLLSDLPSSDPIQFQNVLGPCDSILFKGENTTVIATGTFSAVTAKNRATNQALEATAAGVTWGDYRADGATPARIHDVTNGSVFFVAKDLGSHTARFSEPVVPFVNVATSNYAMASGLIASGSQGGRPSAAVTVGDTWEAQQLTSVYIGAIDVVANTNSTAAVSLGNNIGFQDLHIQSVPGSYNNILMRDISLLFFCWVGCIIQKSIVTCTGEHAFSYCALRRGLTATCGYGRLHACVNIGQLLFNNSALFVDMDTIFQGGSGCNGYSQFGGATRIGTAAAFDITGPGPNNFTGAGMFVAGTTARIGGIGLLGDSTHALWGSGNAGAGIEIMACSTVQYQTNCPTITGTGGDFKLGGAISSRSWDETANAGAGGWSAALITNTWANLVLARGSGGLGEAAANVGVGAYIGKGR